MDAHTFRTIYSSAIGTYNNFQGRTDNLFAENDSTPDVSEGTLFWVPNVTGSITHFDGAMGNAVPPEEGQHIVVGVLGSALFVDSTVLRLKGRADAVLPTGSFLEFVYRGSSWYEVSRSPNAAAGVRTAAGSYNSGYFGTHGELKGFVTDGSTGSVIFARGVRNGSTGQRLAIVNVNSSSSLNVNSAGAIGSFVSASVAVDNTGGRLVNSAAVLVQQFNQEGTAKWYEIVSMAIGSG